MSKKPASSTHPAADRASSPLDGPGFEDSLDQLESIIQRIESGQVGLEAAIAEYEKGVGLLKRCREILKRAEQRVEELNRDAVADGTPAPEREA